MVFRLIKICLYAAMLAVGVALLLAIDYCIHGSYKMFPTEDQDDDVRLVMSIVSICLLWLQALLWVSIKYINRKTQAKVAQSLK